MQRITDNIMDEKAQSKGLFLSIVDGGLDAIMGSLAGGIFLTGFALKILKATPQQIGILAALPMLANLVQIFGSYIIERTGQKKPLCILALCVSRVLWIGIIMLPMAIFSSVSNLKVLFMVLIIAMSSLLASLGGLAWLAWMSDFVPEKIRGTYFGKRNMFSLSCGTVAVLLAGRLLTFFEGRFGASSPYGFMIIFTIGIIVGLIGVWILTLIPEKNTRACSG